MTCIVAVKGKNNDWIIGSDSFSSAGTYGEIFRGDYNAKSCRYFDDPKLVLAHTGITRLNAIITNTPGLTADLVKYEKSLENSSESPKKKVVFDFNYVLTKFIPRINEAVKPYRYANDNKIKTIITSFIIAREDKAFVLTNDGLLMELVDFYAKGSGMSGAVGYYFTNITEKDPVKIALNSLVLGIKSSAGCKFPIRITSTRSDKMYIIEEKDVYAILEGKKEFDL